MTNPKDLNIKNAINENCPWSGNPIDEGSLTTYKGQVVGFCNTGVNAGLKPHQSPEQQCTIWQILVGVKVRHFSGCRFVHRPARRSAPTEQRSCAGLWSNRGVVFAL